MPEVHGVFENAPQYAIRPQVFVRIFIRDAEFLKQINGRDRHFLVVENGVNLFVRFTARPHLEYTPYHACRRLVYYG